MVLWILDSGAKRSFFLGHVLDFVGTRPLRLFGDNEDRVEVNQRPNLCTYALGPSAHPLATGINNGDRVEMSLRLKNVPAR